MDINDPTFWRALPPGTVLINDTRYLTNQQAIRERRNAMRQGRVTFVTEDDGGGDGPGGSRCTGCDILAYIFAMPVWKDDVAAGVPQTPPPPSIRPKYPKKGFADAHFNNQGQWVNPNPGDPGYTEPENPIEEWQNEHGPNTYPPVGSFTPTPGNDWNPYFCDVDYHSNLTTPRRKLVSASGHVLSITLDIYGINSGGRCFGDNGACRQRTGCNVWINCNVFCHWSGPNSTAPTEAPPASIPFSAGTHSPAFTIAPEWESGPSKLSPNSIMGTERGIPLVNVEANCGGTFEQRIISFPASNGGNPTPPGYTEPDEWDPYAYLSEPLMGQTFWLLGECYKCCKDCD